MTWLSYHMRSQYPDRYCPTIHLQFKTLDEHASTLARNIQDRLTDTVQKVDFVTYSMGGLLFRAMLNHLDPSIIGKVVMVAPPNQGAEMAALVRRFIPLHNLGWDPLQQLLPQSPNQLPEPDESIPVLIIAGVKGDGRGYQPLLSEDNDGKVCLSETFLQRPHQHHVVIGRHPALIMQPSTILYIRDFLS